MRYSKKNLYIGPMPVITPGLFNAVSQINAIRPNNQHALNTLLLNAGYINNPGILNGKMGISMLFFYLAKHSQNSLFSQYGEELLDQIYNELHSDTPVDFENGLPGIGWGIEHLLQNKFVEADTDVLEDFDSLIKNELINKIPERIELQNGLLGFGAYFLKRINSIYGSGKISKQMLIHIVDRLCVKIQNPSEILKEPHLLNRKIFDIAWGFPALLWFFNECNAHFPFTSQFGSSFQSLLESLTEKNNHPSLQSNRLLLALVILKIKRKECFIKGMKEQMLRKSIEGIASTFLSEVSRMAIKNELPGNNSTIRYGSSGIALIYRHLYRLTKNIHYKFEMKYWITESFQSTDFMKPNENENAFGIMEGLAGRLMITELSPRN